jgi:ABC-type transport system involved in multi-copper enzyme maturation permease subunit
MKTWALARFTLKETMRSRTMIAGLVISLLYLAIVPMLSTPGSSTVVVGDLKVESEAGKAFLSFALGGLNFIGMIMAILTTLGVIYTEIDKGTIYSLVSKPIHRWQVIFGKWAGHALLMGGYVLLMGFALWLSVLLGSGTIIWSFFPSIALICLNVVTMVTLTMMFSTFLPVIANAIFVFIGFVFSSNLRIIDAISDTSNNIVIDGLAYVFRLLLPVSEVSGLASRFLEERSNAVLTDTTSSFTPRGWIFLYELAYISALVLIATMIFKKKDLK